MKWKNVDAGQGYYYITATFTRWLPLLRRHEIRAIVCAEIATAIAGCGGSVTAFVLMPGHLHLLVYLPREGVLHRFCMLWRGRSARRITALLEEHGEHAVLAVMAEHATKGRRYAVWKEQVRTLPITGRTKLNAMVNYIHANPVRKHLANNPADWPFSSYRFYERGDNAMLEIVPPVL